MRTPESGSHLLDDKTYLQWRDGVSSPCLWIHGAPGAGKTVLSSVIAESILASAGTPSNEMVAFFFCDGGDEYTRTTTDVFSNVIFQCLEQMRLETRDSKISIPQSLLSVFHQSAKFDRSRTAKEDNLEEVLLGMAARTRRLTLVIDGLDELESPGETVAALLRLTSRAQNIRAVLLSRDVRSIRSRIDSSSSTSIFLCQDFIQYDVRSYVQRHADTIPVEDEGLRQDIVDEICNKCKGMFLWAHLVLQKISTAVNVTALKESIQCCPPGLDGIYRSYLNSLAEQDPSRQVLAARILEWTCCAARPLTLEELEVALCIGSGEEGLATTNEKPLRSTILDLFGPFIVVSTTGNNKSIVRLVHHSFREYLLRADQAGEDLNRGARKFLIAEDKANAQLALRCLSYPPLYMTNPSVQAVEKDTFGQYALTFWCHHTVSASYHKPLAVRIREFISEPERRRTWLRWALFKNSHAYPFQKILRMNDMIHSWSRKIQNQERDSQLPAVITETLSMDILRLIMELPEDAFQMTYFGKLMVLRDMARRLKQKNQVNEAVELLEAVRQNSKGDDAEQAIKTTLVLNALGLLYHQQGRVDLAIHTHRQAFTAQASHLGESHPKALWSINELGRMYRHVNMLAESHGMHARAMATLSKTLPEDHPEVVWTINTLATTLRKMGRHQEALRLHLRAHKTREDSLGQLHVHTLWSCGDVAKCYRDQGCLQEAYSWFNQAVKGSREVMGCDHLDTLWSMNNLGEVMAQLGQFAEAHKWQSQALQAQERILGPEHEYTKWTRGRVEGLALKLVV